MLQTPIHDAEPGQNASRPTGRFESLDSLRGFCALFVCLLHIKAVGFLHNNPFVQEAWLFVDFFFVLSGFVIAVSYGDKLAGGFGIWRFIGLRLGRLYPLHVAILALMVLLQAGILLGQAAGIGGLDGERPFTGNYTLDLLVTQLTFTNVIIFDGAIGWNNPSWSISAEFWTYLIAAIVFVLAPRGWVRVAAVITVAALAVLATSGEANLLRVDEFAIVRCCYGFFLGVLTYRLYRHWEQGLERAPLTWLQGGIVVLVAAFVSVAGKGPVTLLAPPLFALTVLAFATDRGVLGRMMCRPFPRLLGRLSYGIYMVHMLVLIVLLQGLAVVQSAFGWQLIEIGAGGGKRLGVDELSGTLLVVTTLALIVAAAYILNRLVEEPARLWSRRVLSSARVRPSDDRSDSQIPPFPELIGRGAGEREG